jgi:hypothetical protein
VRELLADHLGISLAKNDLVLYSPESRLLYVRSVPENVELLEAFFTSLGPGSPPRRYCVTIEAAAWGPGEENRRTIAFVRCITGEGSPARFEFNGVASDAPKQFLEFEMRLHPDLVAADVELAGEVFVGSQAVAFQIVPTVELAEQRTVFQYRQNDQTLAVVLQVELEKMDGLTAGRDYDWLDERRKEVEAQLERLGLALGEKGTPSDAAERD